MNYTFDNLDDHMRFTSAYKNQFDQLAISKRVFLKLAFKTFVCFCFKDYLEDLEEEQS